MQSQDDCHLEHFTPTCTPQSNPSTSFHVLHVCAEPGVLLTAEVEAAAELARTVDGRAAELEGDNASLRERLTAALQEAEAAQRRLGETDSRLEQLRERGVDAEEARCPLLAAPARSLVRFYRETCRA